MKRDYLFYVLAAVTLWDAVTTIFGFMSAIGDGVLQIILAIAFSIVMTSVFLLRAYIIYKNPSNSLESMLYKFLLVVAVSWDLFTAYIGNLKYIIVGNPSTEAIITVSILTLVTCAAPLLLSAKYYKSTMNKDES